MIREVVQLASSPALTPSCAASIAKARAIVFVRLSNFCWLLAHGLMRGVLSC